MIDEQINYEKPASEEMVRQVIDKLRERNMEAIAVDDGHAALKTVLDLIPLGAEVHSAKSKTLEDIGAFDILHNSGQYDALRNRYSKMDRNSQAREIRKLIGAPDFMLGSVNALTEEGILVSSSASASQIGPYASTAGKVIFVVGSQKIVPDLDSAFRRIREFVLPWEDIRVRKARNSGSFIGKTLIVEREWVTGRTTVILVRQPVGI